ncbi:pyruvate dehydrogenase (acetyl-transferring) E1 component subunit alpha [Halegenticoccus tardaugens]|uniref:pyruvate dehydrogenase (acetyl-transferring) E1 component subunit alpha n=1 Tax=Halegenticoccus tardaugens TaxID=2071624 RepID=UPI00100A7F53|nr:pyruvate dehydrogenase (acetyl-transferring) E1 component subunit alpha [Halegenticoccus tardaugens]
MSGERDLLANGTEEPVRILDADGTVVAPELVPDVGDETLRSMYRDVRFCRRFDERAIALQRQGRIGTYSSLAGQEGSQIGSTYALADDDLVSYQYREHGAVVARGFPWEYLLYWAGHERGNEALADLGVLPLNITIGDHLPHAVGMAWAAKLEGDGRVALAHFGDGATSEGDFHEAMNVAGVFDVPAVFVCNNNGWAISTPADRQTASETFAQKADAYGFEGTRVDGMDPLATYVVVRAAREKALNPDESERRPTLVEAVQYRFGAHTTADDPTAYRDEREVERWRRRDPISRFETFLRETGRLDDERVAAIEDEIEGTLARAIDRIEGHEADPDAMFEHAFDEPTDEIRDQRDHLRDLRETYGDAAFLRDE